MKSSCPYCGNNPVPHFVNWYFETSDVLLAPLRRFLVYNFFSRRFKRFLRKKNIVWRLVKILINLKILSLQPDVRKCKIRRAQVLWEEAERRGIKMREMLLFGRPFDTYIAENSEIRNPKSETNSKSEILNPKSRIIFSGLPRPLDFDDASTELMDDKLALKRKLQAAGLPVPLGGSAARISSAVKIFNSISKPVIVKPRTGSRGRHTTTFVCTEDDLRQAVKNAKQLCAWVVVEEQLFGPVYRATIIGGPSTALGTSKLAGVLRGDPPQVLGDGISDITQLISVKNSLPHPGVKDIVIDAGIELFLSRQNLKLSSVLPTGQAVNLTEKIGVNYGGSSSEDFEICHPDNKELFLRAAQILGDPIVGFDFIILDITRPWRGQKCGFIEANSLPFINLHHDALLGKPRNAAALVWDMIGW